MFTGSTDICLQTKHIKINASCQCFYTVNDGSTVLHPGSSTYTCIGTVEEYPPLVCMAHNAAMVTSSGGEWYIKDFARKTRGLCFLCEAETFVCFGWQNQLDWDPKMAFQQIRLRHVQKHTKQDCCFYRDHSPLLPVYIKRVCSNLSELNRFKIPARIHHWQPCNSFSNNFFCLIPYKTSVCKLWINSI